MNLAVEAMRLGAAYALPTDDYAPSTWQTALEASLAQIKEEALKAISSVVPSYKSQRQANTAAPGDAVPQRQLVYVDPISRHLLALAQRVAQANLFQVVQALGLFRLRLRARQRRQQQAR